MVCYGRTVQNYTFNAKKVKQQKRKRRDAPIPRIATWKKTRLNETWYSTATIIMQLKDTKHVKTHKTNDEHGLSESWIW